MIYGRYFDLPRKVIRERADSLLDFAQLTERAHDRVESLSGGMKRRLTIARSLISDPELLILDEPTTGLDPQARHLLWDRLYRLKREGVTLVITTHYMDEAEQLCDRLVVMDHGRFAAEGSPRDLIDELLDQRGRRAALRGRRARRAAIGGSRAGRADRGAARPAASVHRRRGRQPRRGPPAGPRPESALVRRSTLEDVFLRLTGRTLVDERPWPRTADAATRRRPPGATPLWSRALLLGLPVQADLAGLDHHELPVSRSCTWPAMGVGLGSLVDKHAHTVGGVSYLDFIAPGLLAATAMQIGANEAMYPVMGAIKWIRTYFAMLATPLRVDRRAARPPRLDRRRLAIVSPPSTSRSSPPSAPSTRPLAILALPAAVLTGLSFAAPIAAFAATQERTSASPPSTGSA